MIELLTRPERRPAVSPEAPLSQRPARRTRSSHRRQWGIMITLSLIVAVSLAPYLLMVFVSGKSRQQYEDTFWQPDWPIQWDNYAVAWKQIAPYLLTSVIVAAVSIVGIVVISAVTGFVISRYRFVGRNLFFALIAILLMIPSISSLIPLFVMMRDFQLLNTIWVMIIPHVVGGAVIGTVLMRTFVDGIPQTIFDAARIDGASAPRLFRSIMIPLSYPVMGSVALITINSVWNDFFWPLLTISDNSLRPISVGLLFFSGQNGTDYGPMFAGYLLSSLPLVILFSFLSKYFLAGVQGGLPGSH
jgi:ABC-type glycerol-3-phosphate transport system permease component